MVASLIAPQTERIREISGRIQKLESLLDGGAARSQQLESAVSELRGALPPVADLECVARQTLAAELVHQAGQSLRARRPAQ